MLGAIAIAVVSDARANPAVTIPEAVGKPLPVSGTMAFMVIEPGGGTLRVSVIQQLVAVPEHLIPGTDPHRLMFPVPEVAPRPRHSEPVALVSGWRQPRVVNGSIIDAVPPHFSAGEVAYAFVFQPRGATTSVHWILPYGAADVELLVPERGIRASGTGLRGRGTVTERGRRYLRWSGGPVRPGEAVSIRVDGLPEPGGRWPEVTAGVLAVALAGGLVVALRRDRAHFG